MSPELLLSILATVLSLAFAYFPGVKDWFDRLSDSQQRFANAGVLFAIVGALFLLSCAGLYIVFACTWDGGWAAFVLFIEALLVNQGVYQLGVKWAERYLPFVARYRAWRLFG